jgi:hypothetical protein
MMTLVSWRMIENVYTELKMHIKKAFEKNENEFGCWVQESQQYSWTNFYPKKRSFNYTRAPLKALTDHLVGGSRVYLFDPYL